MPEHAHVTTQSSFPRSDRPQRWAYVIHIPGMWPYVSHHRYHSEESAAAAGERDLSATLVALLEAEEEDD